MWLREWQWGGRKNFWGGVANFFGVGGKISLWWRDKISLAVAWQNIATQIPNCFATPPPKIFCHVTLKEYFAMPPIVLPLNTPEFFCHPTPKYFALLPIKIFCYPNPPPDFGHQTSKNVWSPKSTKIFCHSISQKFFYTPQKISPPYLLNYRDFFIGLETDTVVSTHFHPESKNV